MQAKKQVKVEEVIEYLKELLPPNKKDQELTETTDIMTEYGLDIISVMETIMELEANFDVSISDDDISATKEKLKGIPTPEVLTKLINMSL